MRPRAMGLLIPLIVAGCAQEREPIDRTQPNALRKSFFVGEDLLDPKDDPEFWAQGTLIRVGYGASQDGLFTSTYAQPVTRIKWVVQEKHLIGRLTYERVEGSDGMGAGPASDDGQIAYVYDIESHFDVRRAYNPLTGEEMNILEENTTDRPWYEREYMRVNWAKNLNTDAYELDTLSQINAFGGVEYEALAYYVNDPTHADAPHFDEASGYFDVTNKAFARPKKVDLSHLGWGIDEFPACFLPGDFAGGVYPAGNCNPVELTIRQSFRRVTDQDYEPAEWDGHRFQAFGAFTTERLGYARNFGMSDDKWRRFISRYDIWERSHFYADPAAMTGEVACFTPATTPYGADPHRDLNGDGTEDECAQVGGGSRCDEFKQRCTLPFRQRKTRPVVWYYTPDSHPDFFEPSHEAAQQWDVAMRSAVMAARYAECVRVEKSAEACRGQHPMYFGQQDENDDALALVREVEACRAGRAYAGQSCDAVADAVGRARGYGAAVIALAKLTPMVVLCKSPVAEGDPAVCGPRGLHVRQGDLRYHQINVIRVPQTPSPWGIYTDAHDPLTGETLAASINVWSHVNDLFSQGIVDKLRYMNGELTTSEVTEGQYVKDWVQAGEAAGSGILPGMTRAAMNKRIAELAGTDAAGLERAQRNVRGNAQVKEKLARMNQQLTGVMADGKAPSTTAAAYEARRKRALGTPLEAELNTRMMQELAGVQKLAAGAATVPFSSPLQGNNPVVRRSLQAVREMALADKGACIRHEAPSPTSLSGLGELLQEKFGRFDPTQDKGIQQARAERMRRYVASRAHFSVMLHEMGHSVGLRHNFVSSSDAWGYRPQYWQLRTKNKAGLPECSDLSETGEDCVGPRWFDPVTPDEKRQLIWMFMHSSVMDYAGEHTQDLLGLGAYDFAAARMFYGDVASVHADESYRVGTDRGAAMLAKADNFGGIIGYQWSTNGSSFEGGIHYSQLDHHFDLIRDCHEVDPDAFRPADWDEAELGRWHPVLDGQLVQVDGVWSRCRQQPVDYVSWSQLRPASNAEAGGFSRGNRTVDAAGRTRVPYGFATDRWADLGNLAVYRHDNGADPYELFDFFISEQEVNHIFDNYRRGRQGFTVRGAVNRTLGRYNEKMRDGAKGLGLFANIYRDFALAEGYDYTSLWPAILASSPGRYNALGTNALASGIAFDHFTRMMSRPEAGGHYLRPGDAVLRSLEDAEGNGGELRLLVPNGATGFWEDVGIGGRPVENSLATDKGEYNSEYTVNAGSYYEKAFSTMLLTESVDNFISDSRRDFVDGRYRAVSMADLFPEAYRRWLANNLTGDDRVKGAWVEANGSGPDVDPVTKFPTKPMGFTSWWSSAPEVCFPNRGSTVCHTPSGIEVGGETGAAMIAVDPQVGWEQQKFLIAWTLMYLPENQQRWWLDMMGIWSMGEDSDPGFANRIELRDPSGQVLVAKTFGKEAIFGQQVQRGIAARMLEYANQLMAAAYVTDPGPDLDRDGQPDWHIPRLGATGQPVVRWDRDILSITPDGRVRPSGRPGCNSFSSADCKCTDNRACVTLQRYLAVPSFMRQAMRDFGLADPSMRGIY